MRTGGLLAAEYLCIDVSLFRSHYASFGCIYCGLSKLKFLQLSRAPLRMVNSPAKLFKALLFLGFLLLQLLLFLFELVLAFAVTSCRLFK